MFFCLHSTISIISDNAIQSNTDLKQRFAKTCHAKKKRYRLFDQLTCEFFVFTKLYEKKFNNCRKSILLINIRLWQWMVTYQAASLQNIFQRGRNLKKNSKYKICENFSSEENETQETEYDCFTAIRPYGRLFDGIELLQNN